MNGFDTRGRAPSSASFFYTIGDKTWKNGPSKDMMYLIMIHFCVD